MCLVSLYPLFFLCGRVRVGVEPIRGTLGGSGLGAWGLDCMRMDYMAFDTLSAC